MHLFFFLNCCFIMGFFFLAAPSTALTFLLHFLFASLSSLQLMTTNTQMVSPSLTICHSMLSTISCLAPLHILTPNQPSSILHWCPILVFPVGLCVVTLIMTLCVCARVWGVSHLPHKGSWDSSFRLYSLLYLKYEYLAHSVFVASFLNNRRMSGLHIKIFVMHTWRNTSYKQVFRLP